MNGAPPATDARDAAAASVGVHPGRVRRVLLAGDSTVAPYIATEFPLCGWGAHLGAALNALRPMGEGPVHVVDLARNGATTRSHREDGLWDALLSQARAGDAVLLQFGHNDQKHADLDPAGGYTAQLTRMIGEIRELGAHPVLCTPVARRHYAEGRLLETHGAYPQAVQDLGRALDVPVLDLHAATRALILDRGEDGSQALFGRMTPGESPLRPDGLVDDTHFSIDGAITVADLVAPMLLDVLAERPEHGALAERPEHGALAERPEHGALAERPEHGALAERSRQDAPVPHGGVRT